MSTYRYYEFLAVDRPLTSEEMDELGAISSRADISPTHFANEYSYGDLRADPGELLARYFDVLLHMTNWGTQRLGLRLPCEAVALDEIEPYCTPESVRAREVGDVVVVDLRSESEDYDGWIDGQGVMGSLAGVRALLLGGDARPLYIGWLAAVDAGEVDEEALEPPVPPGLGTLTGELRALAEFLRVDDHLLAAAADGSAPAQPEPDGLAAWISALPPGDKDALLLRVAQGDHARVAAALARRFRRERTGEDAPPAGQRRSVEALQATADELREAAARERARKAEQERKAREAVAAAARARRLKALAPRKPEAWREVDDLIATTQPKSYDKAAALLVDLRDLAVTEGDEAAFSARLGELRQTHARKKSFLERLDRASAAQAPRRSKRR